MEADANTKKHYLLHCNLGVVGIRTVFVSSRSSQGARNARLKFQLLSLYREARIPTQNIGKNSTPSNMLRFPMREQMRQSHMFQRAAVDEVAARGTRRCIVEELGMRGMQGIAPKQRWKCRGLKRTKFGITSMGS